MKYPLLGLIFIGIIVIVVMICWSWHKSTSTVTQCGVENLQLSAGQQSGAAGTIYQHIIVTNTGTRTCTMSGYPTVFLYGSNGYALGSGAAAQPQPALTAVSLAPGGSAYTVVGYPQAGNFNPGVCSSTKSTSLKLYTPGAITPLEMPLEVAWCPGFSSTAMQAGS
jgi:hypothetical protein